MSIYFNITSWKILFESFSTLTNVSFPLNSIRIDILLTIGFFCNMLERSWIPLKMAHSESITCLCIPCYKYVNDYFIWYSRIPRPQLGMAFEAIKLLDPAHVDKIWRMCHIDDGLVVQEVYRVPS